MRQTTISSVLNYLVSIIFIAISIALLWSGPQNWAIVPFLVLMSVLFFKKKGKEEFWKPGMKLFNPLLCFYFVVSFIQALDTGAESSVLWCNAALALVSAYCSYYNFVIKPKKEGK